MKCVGKVIAATAGRGQLVLLVLILFAGNAFKTHTTRDKSRDATHRFFGRAVFFLVSPGHGSIPDRRSLFLVSDGRICYLPAVDGRGGDCANVSEFNQGGREMARFLVTGGAGFIGSNLAEALVKRGDQVRVLDNFSTGHRSNLDLLDIELMEGDITHAETVAAAVDGVDYIYHQAALASVPRSVKNPLATNEACVTGTVNVLCAARQAGVHRVIYAASSSAYGDQPFMSKREMDKSAPLSPYAAAKLAGEYYCHAFYHTYGLETVCIRYFNVFGPRQDPGSPYSAVIPLFITALLKRRPPIVYGDGEQTRDFTFIQNVIHGNLLAAEARAEDVVGKTFNVANGTTTSLNKLLRLLNELLGSEIHPKYEPARIGDVRDSLADISLARQYLGYEPVVDFEEGLRKSIDFYKSQLVSSK